MTLYYNVEKLVNGFNQVMTVRVEVEGPKCEEIENISVSLYFRGIETDITDLLDKADLLDKLLDGIDWPMIYAETRASND